MAAPPPYSQSPPYPTSPSHPMPPPPTQTVVITTTSVGTHPAHMVCPSCGFNIYTRVEKEPTTKTHLFALLLCLIGFWPCVWIPYCTDSCQGANHYCPNCGAYIGTYAP